MDDYEPADSFDAERARRYDSVSQRGDEAETVAFLRRLAGDGPALELAIGTGRIALPLAELGVPVTGIDFSPGMIAELRAKPGGDRLAVTLGDFADVPVTGSFRLVYLVFNTLFNLLTQDDQVRCFVNVAEHLSDDGSFVVEAFVPSFLYRLDNERYVELEALIAGEVRLDVGRHDPVTQRLDESHVTLSAEGTRLDPIVCRYAWPSELDLMAGIAGLELADRWGGWQGEPFTAASDRHVSVYTRSRSAPSRGASRLLP
jgi:hypothetical protein